MRATKKRLTNYTKNILTRQEFKEILEQLENIDPNIHIDLQISGGEPTLDIGQLQEVCNIFTKWKKTANKNITFTLVSNGSFATKHLGTVLSLPFNAYHISMSNYHFQADCGENVRVLYILNDKRIIFRPVLDDFQSLLELCELYGIGDISSRAMISDIIDHDIDTKFSLIDAPSFYRFDIIGFIIWPNGQVGLSYPTGDGLGYNKNFKINQLSWLIKETKNKEWSIYCNKSCSIESKPMPTWLEALGIKIDYLKCQDIKIDLKNKED